MSADKKESAQGEIYIYISQTCQGRQRSSDGHLPAAYIVQWYMILYIFLTELILLVCTSCNQEELTAELKRCPVNTQALIRVRTDHTLRGDERIVLQTSLDTSDSGHPRPIQAQHSISLHDNRVSSPGRALLAALSTGLYRCT